MKRIMFPGIVMLLSFVAVAAWAESPQAITDLKAALKTAKAENKMLFIQYGRDKCGNCRLLRKYISGKKLKLPPDKFVYADLNCDDPETDREFCRKFKVDGTTLPFVVVSGPDGKQLAARSGYGQPEDFEKLIKEAKKNLSQQQPAGSPRPGLTMAGGMHAPPADIPADETREMRDWKPRTGPKLKARLYEMSKGQLSLRRENGSTVTYHMSALSKDDHDYISSVLAPPPADEIESEDLNVNRDSDD